MLTCYHGKMRIIFNRAMSNDQPTFKVTDRRLFNADGSPRDLPPEEKPEPKPETGIRSARTRCGPRHRSAAQAEPEPPASAAEDVATDDDPEFTEEELADARDPAGFLSFIMSIASNAASALGMMEHPVTHQREVDVELGKHWIDVLGMLQKKTQGNLSLPKENRCSRACCMICGCSTCRS